MRAIKDEWRLTVHMIVSTTDRHELRFSRESILFSAEKLRPITLRPVGLLGADPEPE